MSGGSFNYLYTRDPQDLLESGTSDLEKMRDELLERGILDAAGQTDALIETIRQARRVVAMRAQLLSDVWHAVEWDCSGDWGPKDVDLAVAKYRENTKEIIAASERRAAELEKRAERAEENRRRIEAEEMERACREAAERERLLEIERKWEALNAKHEKSLPPGYTMESEQGCFRAVPYGRWWTTEEAAVTAAWDHHNAACSGREGLYVSKTLDKEEGSKT